MNDWLLLPRPQRFTELYFTDHTQIPAAADAGSTQKLLFTVHNLENRDTTYRYQLIAVPENGTPDRPLGEGTVTLTHNQLQTIDQAFVLPAVSGRAAIKINLSYEGIPTAGDAPVLQTQSIHWWVNIVPHSNNDEKRYGG